MGAPPGGGWVADRLLARLAPEDRESALGDLHEIRTALRAHGVSRGRAAWTYWFQLLGMAVHSRRPRPHPSPPTGSAKGAPMTRLLSDLRLAVRGFRRAPLFTAVAILTLALGIGATTAMFSVLNPVLLRPLPYPDADRVVLVWERERSAAHSTMGYATFADLRDESRTLEAAAAVAYGEATLLGDGEPERLPSLRVSQEYLRVLGVAPALGRDFTAEEDIPGSARVVILSHGLWQRRFGGDPGILGRTVVLSDIPFTVIGVMPAEFRDFLAPEAQIWTTLRYADQSWACRTCRHLRMVARLAPDAPVATAQRELDLRFERILASNPTEYGSVGTTVVPLQSQLTGDIRGALLAITVGVGFVLLIAVANVMHLQLGRAMRRQGEFAIRGALGASRGQVMRQLLTENLLLAAVAGVCGTVVAWTGIRVLTSLDRLALPRLDAVELNGTVLAFSLAVTLVAGVAFGLAPAWLAAREDLNQALKQGARGGGGARHRLRAGLVVAEVALALVLLVGAGLMMRSLSRLLGVELGFEPERVLTMEVRATGARYDSSSVVVGLANAVVDEVVRLPGVEAAGWASMLPLGGDFNRYGVRIASQPLDNPEEAPAADRYLVTPGYLPAMGITIREGRGFTTADREGAARAAIVNRTFAAAHWPGGTPLGDRVQLGGADSPWWTVVGVADDVKHIGLDSPDLPQVYLPLAQWHYNEGLGGLVVKTRGDPLAAAGPVRDVIRRLEPDSPISRVVSMDQLLAGSTAERRYTLWLFGGFAAVALLLAAAGIFGVLANSVQERTREIGIRTALGAARATIIGRVLAQGLGLTVVGVLLGGAGALALSRLLQGLLFEVRPGDPATFLTVTVVLVATAAAACWIPARRAASVPPSEVLREG